MTRWLAIRDGAKKKMLDSDRFGKDDEGMDTEEPPVSARMRRVRVGLLVTLGLGAGLSLLWIQREPITHSYVDDALAERGVDARYRISDFGFREQTLEDLVIGDPSRPDLVAERVKLRFGWDGFAPTLRMVRAEGVRLKASVKDGRLALGQLDRLMPAPSDQPFTLPDLHVVLRDARVRLDTPAGQLGIAVDGAGNLASGFSGRLAAVGRTLTVGGCTAIRPTAFLHLATVGRHPAFDGPVRMAALECDGVSIRKPEAAIDVGFGESLGDWNGGARFATGLVQAGDISSRALRGRVSFKGDTRATDARLRLTVAGTRTPELLPALADTPLAPFVAALGGAGRAAARRAEVDAAMHLSAENGGHVLRVAPLSVTARNGARVELTSSGRGGLAVSLPDGRVSLDGRIDISGGGLPEAVVQVRDDQGTVHMRPWSVPNGRLLLDKVRFSRDRVRGRVLLDGPVGDGRIEGLSLPVDARMDGRRGLVFNPGCSPVSFRSLAVAGMRIGQTAFGLCGSPGGLGEGGSISAPRIAGTLGDKALTVAAQDLRFDARRQDMLLSGLAVRLGESRLDVTRLQGGMSGGRFEGATGQLEAVPLRMSGGSGTWRLAEGALRLDGRVDVDDAVSDPRFYRLASEDVVLTLKDGDIAMTGTLRSPLSSQTVAKVRIDHDLERGNGRALLDVPGLRFAPDLQPEQLTRLTLGVVANVSGEVSGRGRIFWDDAGVRSDGDFKTDSMDLAAAFGPVSRLSGKIHFSDLLGMETPPGQEVLLGEVNPGVAVIDGVVRYQLLPGQVVRIESGAWPFSGGRLALDPTKLDFGQPSDRHLTFRVEGMDAALFVQQFEFKNVSVSGVFDGVLPMVFDAQGGRIEKGRMVVRKGGGTVAYVGELSNENLGRFAGMAFDALKSIRYDNLAIELDGSLDGELVTRVVFNGVNKAPVGEKRGLVRQFTNLPFRFNITITAPFRSLLNSAQAINDPRGLVQSALERERTSAVKPGLSQ